MTDHDKLREAIAYLRAGHADTLAYAIHRDIVLAAAESTLPKTKMVEVWHIEGSTKSGSPWVQAELERSLADAYAARLRNNPNHTCIRVTGPHQQEVPA